MPNAPVKLNPSRPWPAWGAFALYTTALLAATHWPGAPSPEVVAGLSDKVVHAGAYAGWAMLLALAWRPARRLFGRGQAVALLLGAAMGALDEATQAVPVFGRQADFLDFAADLAGLGAGLTLAGFLGRFGQRRGAAVAETEEKSAKSDKKT